MNLAAGGESAVLTGLLTGRFLSLHTATPGVTGANEVATGGSGYARQSLPVSQAGSNPTVASNSALIDFPPALSGWGTITHYGIWSAVSGGTFLGGDPLSASRDIVIGDIARFNASALQLSSD